MIKYGITKQAVICLDNLCLLSNIGLRQTGR